MNEQTMHPARKLLFFGLRLSALLLVLAWALPALAQQPGSVANKMILEAKERYGFEHWPTGELRTGLPLAEVGFPGFRARKPMDFMPGAPVVLRFMDDKGAARFLLEISVEEGMEKARDMLAGYIAFVSGPRLLPTAESLGFVAGDIGFVGLSREGRMAWIAFVRGNVTVRVCCMDPRADPHPDLQEIASRIDGMILSQPVAKEGMRIALPAVTRFLPAAPTCRAGDAVALDLQVTDPGGEPAAIAFSISGSGQGYVEKSPSGSWMLHTTGAGTLEVTCHVLGARGFSTTRSLSIQATGG